MMQNRSKTVFCFFLFFGGGLLLCWFLLQHTAVDYNIFKDIAAQIIAQFVS